MQRCPGTGFGTATICGRRGQERDEVFEGAYQASRKIQFNRSREGTSLNRFSGFLKTPRRCRHDGGRVVGFEPLADMIVLSEHFYRALENIPGFRHHATLLYHVVCNLNLRYKQSYDYGFDFGNCGPH